MKLKIKFKCGVYCDEMILLLLFLHYHYFIDFL